MSDVSDLKALQDEAKQQYIEESMNLVKTEMEAQEAQMAKQAAEAWAKAQ